MWIKIDPDQAQKMCFRPRERNSYKLLERKNRLYIMKHELEWKQWKLEDNEGNAF